MDVHQPLAEPALKHTKVLEQIVQHAHSRRQSTTGGTNGNSQKEKQLFDKCIGFIRDVHSALSKLSVYSINRDCSFSKRLLESLSFEVKPYENSLSKFDENDFPSERDLLEQAIEHLASVLVCACARTFVEATEDESAQLRSEKRLSKGIQQAVDRSAFVRRSRRCLAMSVSSSNQLRLEDIISRYTSGKFEELYRKKLDEFDAAWSNLHVAQLAAKVACTASCTECGTVDMLFLETDLARSSDSVLKRVFQVQTSVVPRRGTESNLQESGSRSENDLLKFASESQSEPRGNGSNEADLEPEPRARSATRSIGPQRSASVKRSSDGAALALDVETLLEEWHAFTMENELIAFTLRAVRESGGRPSAVRAQPGAEELLAGYVERVRSLLGTDDADADCLSVLAAPAGDANCEAALLRALERHHCAGDYSACVALLDSRPFERTRLGTRSAFLRLLPYLLASAATQRGLDGEAYLARLASPTWWLSAVERQAETCASSAAELYERAWRLLQDAAQPQPPFAAFASAFLQRRATYHRRVLRVSDALRSSRCDRSSLAGRVFPPPTRLDDAADVATRVRRCDTELLVQLCDANLHDLAHELLLCRRDDPELQLLLENDFKPSCLLVFVEQHRFVRRVFETDDDCSIASLKTCLVDSAARLDECPEKTAFFVTLIRFVVTHVDNVSERSGPVVVNSLVALSESALTISDNEERIWVSDVWLSSQLVSNLPSRAMSDYTSLLQVLRDSSPDPTVEAMVARLVSALVRARPSVVGISLLKLTFNALAALDRASLDVNVAHTESWTVLRVFFAAKTQAMLFRLAERALTVASDARMPKDERASLDVLSATPSLADGVQLQSSADADVPQASRFRAPKMPVPRELWAADESVEMCQCCANVRFTTFTRRHHCRHCGRVVCYRCSGNRATIGNEKAARVCDDCQLIYNSSNSNGSQSQHEQTPVEQSRLSAEVDAKSVERPVSCSSASSLATRDSDLAKEQLLDLAFADTPNVDVCVALLEIDVLAESATLAKADWLVAACDRLTHSLTSVPPHASTAADAERLRAAVERCLLHAKLLYERAGASSGVHRCETFAGVLRLLTLTAAAGGRSLSANQLTTDQVRTVRDRLLESGDFETAVELSTKFGLDTSIVFFRFGLSLLRAHRFADAQAKFSKCLASTPRADTRTSSRNSRKTRAEGSAETGNNSGADSVMLREIVSTLETELDRVKRNPGAFRKADILTEQLVQEAVFYLRSFSNSVALIRFYCKHGLFERALRTLVDSDCPSDSLTLAVLPHALDNADKFAQIRAGMLQIDPSLRRFDNYLSHSCAHLHKSCQFVTLLAMQAFMRDHLRAAFTCINEFYLAKGNASGTRQLLTFADLHARAEHLHRARQFILDYLTESRSSSTEQPSTRGARMEKSETELRKYIATIDYQLDIVEFLVEYIPLGELRSYSADALPTLFGDVSRRFELAVILLERAVRFAVDEERLASASNEDDDSNQEHAIRSLELDRALKYVRIVTNKFLLRLGDVVIEVAKRLIRVPPAPTPTSVGAEQQTATSSSQPIDLQKVFVLLNLIDVVETDDVIERSSSTGTLPTASSDSSSLVLQVNEFDRVVLAVLGDVLIVIRQHLAVPVCSHSQSGQNTSSHSKKPSSTSESLRSAMNASSPSVTGAPPTTNTNAPIVCTTGSSADSNDCSLVLNVAKLGDEFAALKEEINELVELVHSDPCKATALMRVGKLKAAYLHVVSTYKSADDVKRVMDAAVALDEIAMKRLCAAWLQKNAPALVQTEAVGVGSPSNSRSDSGHK